MATARSSILDRIKQPKQLDTRRGVLPLKAFYGRDAAFEQRRSDFYDDVRRITALEEVEEQLPSRRHFAIIDLKDSIALINPNSGPIEYLVYRGDMETARDEEGMGGLRFHTALRFRDLVDGSRVNGMKSPSFEGGGGGGGGPKDITSYQMDCMGRIAKIQSIMPQPWLYPFVESIVVLEQWFDLRLVDDEPRTQKVRIKTIMALHYALDHIAIAMSCLEWLTLRRRWRHDAPTALPSAAGGSLRGPLAATRPPVTRPKSGR